MIEKHDLELILRQFKRRVSFRSEERVRTSQFFTVLYFMLRKLNEMNEEWIEDQLSKGDLKFAHYGDKYKIKIEVEMIEINDKEAKKENGITESTKSA